MELCPIFQIAHFPRIQRVVRTPTTDELERFRRYTARVVELSVVEVSSETPFETGYLLIIIVSLTQLQNPKAGGVHFPRDLPSDALPALEEGTFVRFHGR